MTIIYPITPNGPVVNILSWKTSFQNLMLLDIEQYIDIYILHPRIVT